jgi:hypothetical protein
VKDTNGLEDVAGGMGQIIVAALRVEQAGQKEVALDYRNGPAEVADTGKQSCVSAIIFTRVPLLLSKQRLPGPFGDLKYKALIIVSFDIAERSVRTEENITGGKIMYGSNSNFMRKTGPLGVKAALIACLLSLLLPLLVPAAVPRAFAADIGDDLIQNGGFEQSDGSAPLNWIPFQGWSNPELALTPDAARTGTNTASASRRSSRRSRGSLRTSSWRRA